MQPDAIEVTTRPEPVPDVAVEPDARPEIAADPEPDIPIEPDVAADEAPEVAADPEPDAGPDAGPDVEPCTARAYQACWPGDEEGADVYWFDSCGNPEESPVVSCPAASSRCKTIGAAGVCLCAGNWDPATACTSCKGDFTVASGCTECVSGFYGAGCNCSWTGETGLLQDAWAAADGTAIAVGDRGHVARSRWAPGWAPGANPPSTPPPS